MTSSRENILETRLRSNPEWVKNQNGGDTSRRVREEDTSDSRTKEEQNRRAQGRVRRESLVELELL